MRQIALIVALKVAQAALDAAWHLCRPCDRDTLRIRREHLRAAQEEAARWKGKRER